MVERSLGVGETPGSIPGSPMFYLIRSRKSDLRGIAQLAERLFWDQEVLSSSLSTPRFTLATPPLAPLFLPADSFICF